MKEKIDEIEFNAEHQFRRDQIINQINSLSSEEYAVLRDISFKDFENAMLFIYDNEICLRIFK